MMKLSYTAWLTDPDPIAAPFELAQLALLPRPDAALIQ